MKKFNAVMAWVLLAVVVVGCGGVEKILPRKDGTWRTTSVVYSSYVNNALDTSYTDPTQYTYVFDKSGSATMTDDLGTYNITWYVNPEGDLMTTCTNVGQTQNCTQYVVLESDKDYQHWKATINGVANGSYEEIDTQLERVK